MSFMAIKLTGVGMNKIPLCQTNEVIIGVPLNYLIKVTVTCGMCFVLLFLISQHNVHMCGTSAGNECIGYILQCSNDMLHFGLLGSWTLFTAKCSKSHTKSSRLHKLDLLPSYGKMVRDTCLWPADGIAFSKGASPLGVSPPF